jgi:hypothetical protein
MDRETQHQRWSRPGGKVRAPRMGLGERLTLRANEPQYLDHKVCRAPPPPGRPSAGERSGETGRGRSDGKLFVLSCVRELPRRDFRLQQHSGLPLPSSESGLQ